MGSTAKAAKANGKAKLLQRKEENILHSLSLSLFSRKLVFPVLCFAQTLQLQQVVQLLPSVDGKWKLFSAQLHQLLLVELVFPWLSLAFPNS